MPATKKPDTTDPRAIAAAAAEEYFTAITESADLGDVYDENSNPLETAMEEIGNALEADRVKARGPIPDVDAEFTWEQIGRKAGYLVGVQVGLRLRSNGGAR